MARARGSVSERPRGWPGRVRPYVLTIDVDRDLRLVYYAAREGQAQGRRFEQWLMVKDGLQL